MLPDKADITNVNTELPVFMSFVALYVGTPRFTLGVPQAALTKRTSIIHYVPSYQSLYTVGYSAIRHCMHILEHNM